MKELNYNDILPILNEKLANGGVFFNVQGVNGANTMTIGWAYMGTSWRKNIFIAMIRPQRYSFGLVEAAGEFTVSIPTGDPLKKELAFAGTESGRDVNKFEGHGLTAVPALKVGAPIVKECGLHIECKVVSKQMLSGEFMNADIHDRCYPADDYHMLYFGEVVACYSTEE